MVSIAEQALEVLLLARYGNWFLSILLSQSHFYHILKHVLYNWRNRNRSFIFHFFWLFTLTCRGHIWFFPDLGNFTRSEAHAERGVTTSAISDCINWEILSEYCLHLPLFQARSCSVLSEPLGIQILAIWLLVELLACTAVGIDLDVFSWYVCFNEVAEIISG